MAASKSSVSLKASNVNIISSGNAIDFGFSTDSGQRNFLSIEAAETIKIKAESGRGIYTWPYGERNLLSVFNANNIRVDAAHGAIHAGTDEPQKIDGKLYREVYYFNAKESIINLNDRFVVTQRTGTSFFSGDSIVFANRNHEFQLRAYIGGHIQSDSNSLYIGRIDSNELNPDGIWAKDNGVIKINAGEALINTNILVEDYGQIRFNFTDPSTVIRGKASVSDTGRFDLRLKNGGTWIVTGESTTTIFDGGASGKSFVDLHSESAGTTKLNINSLRGTGITFDMDVDFNKGTSDQIVIHGDSQGEHFLRLRSTGTQNLGSSINLVYDFGGEANFKLAKNTKVEIGNYHCCPK